MMSHHTLCDIICDVSHLLNAAVLDTLILVQMLPASLLNSLAKVLSISNRIKPVCLAQTISRTLAGGAISGGGECCGCKLQSVHAGKKMEERYKTNLLVSEAQI